MSGKDAYILLIEDDALTVRIIQCTFLKHKITNPIHVATYDQHIAGYLLKSQAGYDFLQVVQLVEQFVLAVQFPPAWTSNPPLPCSPV